MARTLDTDRVGPIWWAVGLITYLLILGLSSATGIVLLWPDNALSEEMRFVSPLNQDQGLICLALLAGLVGSFQHTAQSLITYIGKGQFERPWIAWYVVRPWLGALLGFTVYFACRAGLVTGATGMNPYGVVALGVFAGWFSKTATNKLQEVFETFFRTEDSKDA